MVYFLVKNKPIFRINQISLKSYQHCLQGRLKRSFSRTLFLYDQNKFFDPVNYNLFLHVFYIMKIQIWGQRTHFCGFSGDFVKRRKTYLHNFFSDIFLKPRIWSKNLSKNTNIWEKMQIRFPSKYEFIQKWVL